MAAGPVTPESVQRTPLKCDVLLVTYARVLELTYYSMHGMKGGGGRGSLDGCDFTTMPPPPFFTIF